ncbi:methylated-DNA--[protein]-cysteine S-methyltransferase [Rhodococcus rhodnii]|uniref:Methylated-DNA--[protein]-cysteine n=2 Tax=Rhodococcus rhodnii TaxID=38312 RepID=R7WJ23_9NOCA|nr:methylated-DNA--[protein]-cysteine S-methyltransferase [Rhodococcus rhodnii]EOM75267.1 methylated-DNA--[protein]-cysteine [Rhodococcus rhodnii LMG 5362]TXG92096.1 methylated-DNA--[protein]-cysteine S-methyltransferase [Rhodococcus rhodnii]
MTVGYRLFDTAVGTCAIAWRTAGVVALRLAEPSPEETEAAITATLDDETHDAEPPAEVARVVDAVRAHLGGELDDLRWIAVDLEGIPDFDARVYEITRTIGPGQTRTYGDVASELGSPGAAQAVGQALGRNPIPLIVPCHRVLAASGIGGFSAGAGTVTKRELLALERAPGFDDPVLF